MPAVPPQDHDGRGQDLGRGEEAVRRGQSCVQYRQSKVPGTSLPLIHAIMSAA